MSSAPHVLVLPFPVQGHVIPLLSLSRCLVERGFKVTFVNTEFNHGRIMSALAAEHDGAFLGIDMASIPDGLAPGEDRNDLGRLTDGVLRVMPRHLEEVIQERSERGEKVTWMIADGDMSWAFAVAKMGLRRAAFWPAAAVCLAHFLSIPTLIQDGILLETGWPREKDQTIELFPGAPPLKAALLPWNNAGDPEGQSIILHLIVDNNRAMELAEFIICNSFHEVEPTTFDHFPNILPVGPLLTTQRPDKPAMGHFWSEDTTCMRWLDAQGEGSVVYVAFGSFTVFEPSQFRELALGLELCGRLFLWVVRPDLAQDGMDVWFHDFCSRVAGRGMVVEWSPQQLVLAHPSVACFVSHCGWNSTMEGVWNGLPFLCWPYFADQFINHSYVYNVWQVGLSVEAGKGGIVTKEEIKEKLEALLSDEGIKARAGALKEAARRSIAEGGSSYRNLEKIIKTMKE